MAGSRLTPKGAATRARIVEATADAILDRGIGCTSLDDVRAATATSKSQLFHYFPEGKAELVRAVVDLQGERVLEAQRPALDHLDDWDAWTRWRELVLAHYASQGHWGCPIGSLAAETAGNDEALAAELNDYLRRWTARLRDGLEAMRDAGALHDDADPERLAAATMASLQGGLLLTRTEQALWPLEAALDAALAHLRSFATDR